MYIFILFLVHQLSSLKIKEVDSLYQYSQQSIVLSEQSPSISSAFRYEILSKQNPSTNILQVGNFEKFYSD
ncbi:unnamed protein product [Paramecium pentaurelia]|uniref:Uncharacterized protein n=1 Tax=Paramecium pentaurelia TaxID=43138 RepID=A0A8S1VXS2_9CILI|nr:unnamed protein product [Paramecium pentaurelia]